MGIAVVDSKKRRTDRRTISESRNFELVWALSIITPITTRLYSREYVPRGGVTRPGKGLWSYRSVLVSEKAQESQSEADSSVLLKSAIPF